MNKLRFKNGKFKIMQIADVQEGYPLNPDSIRLIDLALEREKPDLVVFTGDQIQGYNACYKKDTYQKVSNAIGDFLAPLIKRDIPFVLTFGNHDDDCAVSKSAQYEIYRSFTGFVETEIRSPEDTGTSYLTVSNSVNEKDVLAIYLIDSNKKDPNGVYEPVKKEQIEWLESVREKNNYLPAIAFQHIPVPEFYDVLEKVPFYKKGALEAYKSRKNTFWILPGEGGFMGETPAVPEINNGEFNSLKAHGDILGLYVGHDHSNSFVRRLDGVDLGYTQGAGFNTYGPGDKRGVRLFIFDENDIRNYKTYTCTIGELCSFKPSKPIKEFIFSHVPTCTDEVKTNLKRSLVLSLAATAVTMTVKKLIKK